MSTDLAKPVRVIHELSPHEQLVRIIERATEVRTASIARADATFAEKVKEAVERLQSPSAATAEAPAA